MSEPEGRVALVTGASRGIGRAVALMLARAGVAVAVNYRERRQEADSVVESIQKSGGRAIAFGADVANGSAVSDMVHAVETNLGPIDILVNNAGMASRGALTTSPKKILIRQLRSI